MPYEQQLAEKQKYIDDLLSVFGPVDKIIGMENPYHYRNKVTAAFRRMKVIYYSQEMTERAWMMELEH